MKYSDFVTIILVYNCCNVRKKQELNVCMQQVGRQKFIDKQILAIDKKFENYEIIISLSEHVQDIHRYIKEKHLHKRVRIVENCKQDSNSCEDIRVCLNNSNNSKIMIVDGRIILNDKVLSRLDFSESFAILSENKNCDLEVGANVNKGNVCFFSYGAKYSWAEIIFLNGSGNINHLESVVSKSEFSHKFLFEAMNQIVSQVKIKAKKKKNRINKIKYSKTY